MPVSASGYLRINYDATTDVGPFEVSRGDELEGVTVCKTASGETHVLVIKLSNELDDDDVTLFRFETNEP